MAVSDWIQPADMWLGRAITVHSDVWSRNIGWDPTGLDAAAATAEFIEYWADVLELGSSAFAALAGTGDVFQANESVSHDLTYPFSQYQNQNTSHQSWIGFVELASSTAEDTNPVYAPYLGPGQTVEYESSVGTYLPGYRFQIPSDTDGLFSDGHPLPELHAIDGGGIVGSPSYPGSAFQTWDNVNPNLSGPYDTSQVTRDSSEITVVALFRPQASGVPRSTSPNSGLVTLKRWTPSIDRFFSAARQYRPPRYRIRSSAGAWSLRQRQNAAGTVGGWPLRHRQTGNASGAWPVRHRQ